MARARHYSEAANDMKAMILAAGRGERMRPWTDHTPKPLLKAGGKHLIIWHIEKLAKAGIREIVVNTAHLAELIHQELGTSSIDGVNIQFTHEGSQGLETAGGIRRALPLLGGGPFILINADVWTDFDFSELIDVQLGKAYAHLVLVPNPAHNPRGDFSLRDGMVFNEGDVRLTFSGISLVTPALFDQDIAHSPRLAVYLRHAAELGHVSGHVFHGLWHDIGTPDRLKTINIMLG